MVGSQSGANENKRKGGWLPEATVNSPSLLLRCPQCVLTRPEGIMDLGAEEVDG